MKVMMIGGTIFIGRELSRQLVEAGHEIAFLHRGDHEPPGFDGATHIHVDRKDIASVRDQIDAFGPDAVVDNMAMSAADADSALEVISGRRLLVTSSIDVYRAYSNLTKGSSGEPTPLTETSPVRDERYPYRSDDAPPMMQTYEKLDVEERYLAHDATVIRLPMVYGPMDGQRREWFILRRVAAGRAHIPIGAGTWRSARGFVRDMAKGMRLALESDAAAGEIFNLCESSPVPEGTWAQMILDAAGSPAELVTVPDEVLPPDMGMTGAIAQHLEASNAKARTMLAFTDTDPRDALAESVRWHLDHPPAPADPGDDPGFEADDAALNA